MTDLRERFRNLGLRQAPRPVSTAPVELAPAEKLAADLGESLRQNDALFSMLSRTLDASIALAEANEGASLRDHPLMCHYHGQIAAFKALKAHLTHLRHPDASGRKPGD